MAMLPDEKYPDMSLHPTNSAQMLYGTLQKGKNLNRVNQSNEMIRKDNTLQVKTKP